MRLDAAEQGGGTDAPRPGMLIQAASCGAPYTSTLATMKPGQHYWSLVEPVWETISIYHTPDIFLTQFNSASLASRTLFAAHWCQSEVRNGGFHQFFGNSTGVL